jgi:hypothetical protein
MVARYQVNEVDGPKVVGEIVDALDQLACDEARRMLEPASAPRWTSSWAGSGEEFRGNRNGYGRSRTVGLGTWAVPVQAPRVSDVPEEMPAFEPCSAHPALAEAGVAGTQKLFCQLYREGLSRRNFEPVFRQLLGETHRCRPT